MIHKTIDMTHSATLICDDTSATHYTITAYAQQEPLVIDMYVTGADKKIDVICVMNTPYTQITLKIIVRSTFTNKYILKTYQHHTAVHTSSTVNLKAVVYDTSLIDYEGVITLPVGTQNADAQQTSKFLVMSEKATVKAIPSLSVQHNNVQCGHATLISYIDSLVLFYFAQRGISVECAERIIENIFLKDRVFYNSL